MDLVNEGMDTFADFSTGGVSGLKMLGQGFKNTVSKIRPLLTVGNIVKGLGIGALIGGAGYAIKKSYDSLPSTKAKQLNEMTEEYATNEDKLASLNTELADTQARIEELSLKGHVLYEAAISLIGKNAEFREIHEYYRGRKENPLKKMQSVVAIACKVIRVFYAILTKGVDYDAEKLIGDIRRPQMQAA